MPWRRLPVLLALLIAILLLAAVTRVVFSAGQGEISSELGPQLVLVSPQDGQMTVLARASLTIHTELPAPGAGRYVGSGTASAVAAMRAAGVTVEVLDADTRGKVYYFVERGPAEDESALRLRGRVLYQDSGQFLLALAKSDEGAFLELVATLSLHIELLTSQAIPLDAPSLPAAITPAAADPAIAALLSQVSQSTLAVMIGDLSGERSIVVGGRTVALRTRYSFSSQIGDAVLYLREAFMRMGISPQSVAWTYGRYRGLNVVADLRGAVNPERIWVIGAHLDDRSQSSYTRAPGADDNASGVAAMLVIADIVRQQHLRDTVRFVAFTGEEQGMWGSKSYAASLRASGAQVMGFIDLDMIAYDSNDDRVIELHSGSRQASVDLANAFISANDRYGIGMVVELKQASASRFSDHSSFWDQGYSAIMAIENFFTDARPADRNPWYHNTGDLLARARLSYVTRYTQAALATTLELAGLLDGAPPTATATATRTPSSTATPTPVPSPTAEMCRNLLANGDMETAAGWLFGATARRAAYVSSPVLSGAQSLRTGIAPPTADRRTYSSAYQRVSIPGNAVSAVLTLNIWRQTSDASGDRQEILLLNARYGLLRTLQRGLANDVAWQPVRFDVARYAGQTVVVYFNTYNDGDGRRSWMHIDDVVLEACTR